MQDCSLSRIRRKAQQDPATLDPADIFFQAWLEIKRAEKLEDEAKFIDLANSPLWFAYEYPQINPSPENVVAKVKSGIIRVFFPLLGCCRIVCPGS